MIKRAKDASSFTGSQEKPTKWIILSNISLQAIVHQRGMNKYTKLITVSALEATLKRFWQQWGSSSDGNPTGTAGAREGRRNWYWEVMGVRREGDGFYVCWDGDEERPGGRMILWWRWRIQAKDDGGGGRTSDVRRRGWDGFNN